MPYLVGMRFLHIADVHLDTLFASRSESLRQRLREASREAFRRAVRAALDRKVDAVLIAGDLFDGARLSFETERFLMEELSRLREASIPVVYATGNHDPGKGRARAGGLRWPENVTLVSDGRPERVTILNDEGSAIGTVTASGHATSAVSDDLSRDFPLPEGALPSVALLHTQVISARGSAEHERYAPSELGHLEKSGYDYWALGHVHLRQILSGTPAIHYPGNLQGRNPRETGAKGCLIVDLGDPAAPAVDFLDLAPIRWERLRVDGLEAAGALHTLVGRIASEWEEVRDGDPGAEGVEWIVRVELEGPCPLWRELSNEDDRASLETQLAERLGLLRIEVRAEGVHPVRSVEEHVGRQDVVGESLRLLRELVGADDTSSGRQGASADGGSASIARRIGVEPEELGGFDGRRDGTVDAYLKELLAGREGELLDRLLDPAEEREG